MKYIIGIVLILAGLGMCFWLNETQHPVLLTLAAVITAFIGMFFIINKAANDSPFNK